MALSLISLTSEELTLIRYLRAVVYMPEVKEGLVSDKLC